MTCERITLLRNVGQFDSVNTGALLDLTKLALIYAENGRGKTTLATILRSLNSGEPHLINERKRLGAQNDPHIVLTIGGAPSVFQNGAWSAPVPRIEVFDDAFVAANVCSGIEIATAHRQNLHELILGAQGVTLNAVLKTHVERVEQHNRDLRTKHDAIPAAARDSLTVDAFCALPSDPDVEGKLQDIARSLSAAQSADAVRNHPVFSPLSLPAFDVHALSTILARTLANLEVEAAARVKAHLKSLGAGGEAWVGDGMSRVAAASQGRDHEACPFCAQDLRGSDLISHYQAYFSEAYDVLKKVIIDAGLSVASMHGGEAPAAFERAVRVSVQNREFWQNFTQVLAIEIDTAAVSRAWSNAREAVLAILRAKAAAPFEPLSLPETAVALVQAYNGCRTELEAVSAALLARNIQIAVVKEQAAGANVAALAADLARLNCIKVRNEPATAALCNVYLAEKSAKTATEALRDQARAALDQYRRQVFPAYEAAINDYLERFNAGFRLGSVSSVNNRAGSSASYSVLINNQVVALTANEGPSFKNTLSAGDRNTLALAFFFASLDRDAGLAEKIVVIDDPMTSLDEHRSQITIQEMRRLESRIKQMIVLSHSKPFLCALWEGADTLSRSAMRIARNGAGSTLAAWDVHQDCITEHDRRHQLVSAYIGMSDPATERATATALRYILESFMRVAYPAQFPPGTMLGTFHHTCQQRAGQPNEIMTASDAAELRALLGYANRFHHETNAAFATAAINDQELAHFCRRTLDFTRRA